MNLRTITNASMAVLTVALMSGAPAAFAASVDVTGGNHITGANSDNTNTTSVLNDGTLSVDNFAHALNSLWLDLSNGNNDLSNNTTVGGLSTGNLMVGGTFATHLNNTPILAAGFGDPSSTSAHFTNGTTGSSSVNSNDLSVTNANTTAIDNHASIHNHLGFDVSTGNNQITNNTTVGPVDLGGAAIVANVSNTANAGAALVGPLGGGSTTVSVTGGNDTTGANSLNSNSTTVTNTNATTVENSAHIDNHAHVDASTGNNTIDSNTTVGPIHTGDVLVNLSFTNSAN